MLYEERLCTKRLGVTPSVMVSHLRCHLSCDQTVAQRWEISQELARVANGLRQYCINAEADNNEENDISFGDMRTAQVFQKQRMPLKKLNNRVDQVAKRIAKQNTMSTVRAIYTTASTTAKSRIVSSTFTVWRSGNGIASPVRSRVSFGLALKFLLVRSEHFL